MMFSEQFKRKALTLAEIIDAYRTIPRVLIFSYVGLVAYAVDWFVNIPRIEKIVCDPQVIERLAKISMSKADIESLACRTIDVIGPTTAEAALVSTVIGAAAIVFGMYTNTGRKWTDKPAPSMATPPVMPVVMTGDPVKDKDFF